MKRKYNHHTYYTQCSESHDTPQNSERKCSFWYIMTGAQARKGICPNGHVLKIAVKAIFNGVRADTGGLYRNVKLIKIT